MHSLRQFATGHGSEFAGCEKSRAFFGFLSVTRAPFVNSPRPTRVQQSWNPRLLALKLEALDSCSVRADIQT
jgi:hypothetical protein